LERLETARLVLRRWLPCDLGPFAALNDDPEVMRHFPARMSREQTAFIIARIEAHFDSHGYGLWVVERRDRLGCLGYVGLMSITFERPFADTVEIGWRLAREAWGRGYATEAAREACRVAFEVVALPALVAFTIPANGPSRRVMEKLGMERDPGGDFQHPNLPEGHPMRPHILYRLTRERWRAVRTG
jgi:RimJ/RimL family protein N-acetyltransferase